MTGVEETFNINGQLHLRDNSGSGNSNHFVEKLVSKNQMEGREII